jgi:PIN domain nuclease of toxin-antitoxin system
LKLLLDTHCWLWMRGHPDRFSEATRQLLRAPTVGLHLSVASVWELGIKLAAEKVRLPDTPARFYARSLAEDLLTILPIQADHALLAAALPPHHRDPFDRMLVAQAQHERMTLLTADRELARYAVPIHWA